MHSKELGEGTASRNNGRRRVSPRSNATRTFQKHLYVSSVDRDNRLSDHIDVMAEVIQECPRRSSRVFMRIRVIVEGKNIHGRKFRESCHTIVVNAHGGLLYLNQELDSGAMVALANPFTQDELECRVVFLGELGEKGQRVGVEFLTPAPRFWGVELTPADWNSPSPPSAPSPSNAA